MKTFQLPYLLLYPIIISVSLGTLYIFKPYTYIDNAKSLIVCHKNHASFEIGWNFIYTFDDKLDPWNDEKARKICEYNVIKDYINTVQTPKEINYRFEPKYIQESSWLDSILMFFATLVAGIFFLEVTKKILIGETSDRIWSRAYAFISIILAIVLFLFILKKPAAMIYCKRQVARKVNNFKRVIFKYGVFPIPEEDKHISSLLNPLYEKCLESEKI